MWSSTYLRRLPRRQLGRRCTQAAAAGAGASPLHVTSAARSGGCGGALAIATRRASPGSAGTSRSSRSAFPPTRAAEGLIRPLSPRHADRAEERLDLRYARHRRARLLPQRPLDRGRRHVQAEPEAERCAALGRRSRCCSVSAASRLEVVAVLQRPIGEVQAAGASAATRCKSSWVTARDRRAPRRCRSRCLRAPRGGVQEDRGLRPPSRTQTVPYSGCAPSRAHPARPARRRSGAARARSLSDRLVDALDVDARLRVKRPRRCSRSSRRESVVGEAATLRAHLGEEAPNEPSTV